MRKVTTTEATDLVARHVRPGLPLLTILHGIQAEIGYLPQTPVAALARALNLSRAEVHGFITYYPHFRSTPPAPVTIQLCRAEACQSVGSTALAQHIEQRTHCRFTEHTGSARHEAAPPDSTVSLEAVYCLGQCALSPALTINQRLHAKVTPEKFDALFAAAQAASHGTGETV